MRRHRQSALFSFVKKEMKLTVFVAILNLVNLLIFHIPFFKYVFSHVEMGLWSTVFLVVSLAVVIFAVNYLVFYLLIFLFRKVGRFLVGALLGLSGTAFYFALAYNVIFDDAIMASVFNTRVSEASGFFNVGMVVAILSISLPPWIYAVAQKVDYGKLKHMCAVAGITLGVTALLLVGNMKNVLWIGEHDTELGGLIMPWSFVVNTVRVHNQKMHETQEEILLPDARIADCEKSVFVLVIGESARRANFSLYGYPRNTNPLLSRQKRLHTYLADACDTYTMACTKCILEYAPSDQLYEILPNYLNRNGVDVYWRTSNWGNPPVHVEHYSEKEALRATSNRADRMFDGVLVEGLKEIVEQSSSSKVLIVLHTSTSHGPKYTEKYPANFEVFTPVSDKVEASSRSREALINAYDNSILYTDYLLNEIIEQLKTIDGWHASMLYLSDHGESLGENDMYMHGVPVKIAPKEQIEIPFLLWTSDDWRQLKPLQEAEQHSVFHTAMNFLSVDSPIYNEELDLFVR